MSVARVASGCHLRRCNWSVRPLEQAAIVGSDGSVGSVTRMFSSGVGISAIAVYEPAWRLPNSWFAGLARKFVHHTGTESRPVSSQDEVAMARRAVAALQRETSCDLRDCAGLVFASPSFVPPTVARRHLTGRALRRERLRPAARRLARRLGLADRPLAAINWFCSGYAKALAIARRMARRMEREQFVLVINSSRISRITDYACSQTGPLFGDLATATLLSRTECLKYPVRLELLLAFAEKQPAPQVFFDFCPRENVPAPAVDGGTVHDERRLVFSLDGMGIADIAPRAMASAVEKALCAKRLAPSDVRFVVPHQAGAGIVRLTAMKLEQLGIAAEVVNGITGQVGNVSSCSIPFALKQMWDRLEGTIACPTAAVGQPGEPQISQGCILLRAASRRAALAA